MSIVDLRRHLRDGDQALVPFDILDIVTFGFGSKISIGLKAAKTGLAAAKASRVLLVAKGASPGKIRHAANLVDAAEKGVANAESWFALGGNTDKMVYMVGTLVSGAYMADNIARS